MKKKGVFPLSPWKSSTHITPPKKDRDSLENRTKTHHLSALSAVLPEEFLSRVDPGDCAHGDAVDPVADYGDPGVGFEAGLVPWWGGHGPR